VTTAAATARPPTEWPRAGAIAVSVGPLIDGIFTTCFSWRWVFAGEVPIVVTAYCVGEI